MSNANGVDHNQKPQNAASDQGLRCFPRPHFMTLSTNELI